MNRINHHFSSVNILMSKLSFRVFALVVVSLSISLIVSNVSAQDLKVIIRVSDGSNIIRIDGTFTDFEKIISTRHFAFNLSKANSGNSRENISKLIAERIDKRPITIKKLIPGEFLADLESDSWSYQIDLSSGTNTSDKAHFSWIEGENGVAMLDDLLPKFARKDGAPISARVQFKMPKNWSILSSESQYKNDTFDIEDISKAVVLVGKNWRESKADISGISVNIAFLQTWQFSDSEVVPILQEIVKGYYELFGSMPFRNAQIALIPDTGNFGRWEAETRGNTISIVSGDMQFKKPSLQRLHEQLRHELLHLWIPNGLALSGNYDWFYEGFLIYQALKTGLAINRISFEDFLSTISQAKRLSDSNERTISLIEASKTRKSGSNPQAYAKGMLVAFFCDAAIQRKSKGKNSIESLFRRFYRRHRLPNEVQDGNIAVLSALDEFPEVQQIVERYLKGTEKIGWSEYLDVFGLEEKQGIPNPGLSVQVKLNGRQKDLLDKLGYNNWRK